MGFCTNTYNNSHSLTSQTLGEGRESDDTRIVKLCRAKWPQVADKWVSGPDCARTAANAL